MEAAKTVTTYNISESEEVRGFYRALAVAQANILMYVRRAKSDEDKKNRATQMTKELGTIAIPHEDPISRGNTCDNGTVWNPITERCEAGLLN